MVLGFVNMSSESNSSPRRSSGRPRTAPNYEMLNSGTYTIEDITAKKGNKKNTSDEIESAIKSNSQGEGDLLFLITKSHS